MVAPMEPMPWVADHWPTTEKAGAGITACAGTVPSATPSASVTVTATMRSAPPSPKGLSAVTVNTASAPSDTFALAAAMLMRGRRSTSGVTPAS